MRLVFVVLAIAAFSGVTRADPPTPVLVELFTSEGCSSCPAADALLQTLVRDAAGSRARRSSRSASTSTTGIDSGWKDRFASPALTERQQCVRGRFNTESIYTPQMVVDGRAEFVGSDASAARRAIERALTTTHGVVRIAAEPATNGTPSAFHVVVNVADLPVVTRGDRADILVAVTEDQLRSDVKRGENHGRVLAHAAVVRQLTTIAEATGASASARVDVTPASDWQREHLKIVAFVQERRSRAILAAAAMPLAGAR